MTSLNPCLNQDVRRKAFLTEGIAGIGKTLCTEVHSRPGRSRETSIKMLTGDGGQCDVLWAGPGWEQHRHHWCLSVFGGLHWDLEDSVIHVYSLKLSTERSIGLFLCLLEEKDQTFWSLLNQTNTQRKISLLLGAEHLLTCFRCQRRCWMSRTSRNTPAQNKTHISCDQSSASDTLKRTT